MNGSYAALVDDGDADGRRLSGGRGDKASSASHAVSIPASSSALPPRRPPPHRLSIPPTPLSSDLAAPLMADATNAATASHSDGSHEAAEHAAAVQSRHVPSSFASALSSIGALMSHAHAPSHVNQEMTSLHRAYSEPPLGHHHAPPLPEPHVPSLMERILTAYSLLQDPSYLPSAADLASPPTSPPPSSTRSPPTSPSASPLLSPPSDPSQPAALSAYLTFRDPSIESAYHADYVAKYFSTLWLAVLLSTVTWILFVFTDVYKFARHERRVFWPTVAMRFAVAVVVLMPVWATMHASVQRRVTARMMKAALFVYLLLFATCQLGFGVLQKEILDPTYSCFIILVASMSAATFRLPCFLSIACNTLMCLVFGIYELAVPSANEANPVQGNPWEAVVWIVIAIVLFSFHGYSVEHSMRSTFLSAQQLSVQELRSQSVLATMLPQRVINELRTAHGSFVHSNYTSVSVLFSHVHHFDQHTSSLEPRHVVQLLNNLFSRFDTLTDKLNVYKVETIGDVYLVSAGVPEAMEHHACVLALLAIAMQEEMRLLSLSLRHDDPLNLQLRVGLHSGSVIAGVVGMKYPRYRLMGDTVNTASRMSTTCQPSQIQLSRATFLQLTEQFVCRYNGSRQVKGKGAMETYILKYVLPTAGSGMLPISTSEALGRKSAVQVADELGCAIPTQRRSVSSTLPSHRTSTQSSRASTPHDPPATPPLSATTLPPLQARPLYHAQPVPGRLYSTAAVAAGADWEADDVAAVLVARRAGRPVHLLRRSKKQLWRSEEAYRNKGEMEELKVDTQVLADRPQQGSSSVPSSSPLRDADHQGSSRADAQPDSSSSASLVPPSSGAADPLFISTDRTHLVPPPAASRFATHTVTATFDHALASAAAFFTRGASSSSLSAASTPPTPATPSDSSHATVSSSPYTMSPHISPHVSPHLSPVYSPRPSDVYKISATSVSVSFLRTVPSVAQLQHANPLRLSFAQHAQLEHAFQHEYAAKALRLVRVGFVTFVCCLCGLGVYDTCTRDPAGYPWTWAWAVRAVALVVGLGVVVGSYWKKAAFCYQQQLIVAVCWSLMAALQIVITVGLYAAGREVYGMSIMLILITTTSFFVGLHFRAVCLSILSILLVYLVAQLVAIHDLPLSVCFLGASAALSMLSAHSSEKIQRLDYVRYLRLNNEERKTREILDNMLPVGVMTDIVNSQRLLGAGGGYGGSGIIAHEIGCASVLFCDIVSFTTIASSSSPEDVVAILNIMFSTFDALTTLHSVYKVETIGDAYLACSGVVLRHPSQTENLVKCALDFQSASNYFRTPDNQPLSVRIGIHTGHVVAGVVGRKMPRYHLFGETVTVAEEMEQTGVAGAVVVSGATHAKVCDAFVCRPMSDLVLASGVVARWKVLYYCGGYGGGGSAAVGQLGRDEREEGLSSSTLPHVVRDILSKVHEVNVRQQEERERRSLGTAHGHPNRLAVTITSSNGRDAVLSACSAKAERATDPLNGRIRSHSCGMSASLASPTGRSILEWTQQRVRAR